MCLPFYGGLSVFIRSSLVHRSCLRRACLKLHFMISWSLVAWVSCPACSLRESALSAVDAPFSYEWPKSLGGSAIC